MGYTGGCNRSSKICLTMGAGLVHFNMVHSGYIHGTNVGIPIQYKYSTFCTSTCTPTVPEFAFARNTVCTGSTYVPVRVQVPVLCN